MAKKKKAKHSLKEQGGGGGLLHVSFPERARRLIFSVLMFVLALIFSFAFFEKAGAAGKLFFQTGEFLLGKGVFLLPLFFVVAGLTLWMMRKYSVFLVFFTLVLLILGVSGILGGIARWRNLDVGQVAGWLGFSVSWPVFSAFGFWVSEIIFGAVVMISGVIFWQLLPREKIESSAYCSQIFS